MDQQSLQAGDLRTSAFRYEAPRIVSLGAMTDLTMGISGSGTDTLEAASLGPGFS
jgi:hypothetical protein